MSNRMHENFEPTSATDGFIQRQDKRIVDAKQGEPIPYYYLELPVLNLVPHGILSGDKDHL